MNIKMYFMNIVVKALLVGLLSLIVMDIANGGVTGMFLQFCCFTLLLFYYYYYYYYYCRYYYYYYYYLLFCFLC